jgi:molybdopterin converting factor small subunit
MALFYVLPPPGARQDLGASRVAIITIEVISWLVKELGLGEGRKVIVPENVPDTLTAAGLFALLVERNERFSDVVFDPSEGKLSSHVTIVLNGRLLEIVGGLEAPIRGGDHILFLPAFTGG